MQGQVARIIIFCLNGRSFAHRYIIIVIYPCIVWMVYTHYTCTDPKEILNKNLKVILSLLWSLVASYQTGSKEHLLKWANATLPAADVSNFSSDWNDGHNLSALVNYCKPGLIPTLSSSDRLANVSNAMAQAEEHFGIPQVIHPEDLTVEEPDELSVMLYLSYFPAVGGPAYQNLLSWINRQAGDLKITNFTTDWTSGHSLGKLMDHLSGGQLSRHRETPQDGSGAIGNCQEAMDAALSLFGVRMTLTAEEFADPNLHWLPRMAYLAQFVHAKLPPKGLAVGSPDVCPQLPAANKVKIIQAAPRALEPGDDVSMVLDTSAAGDGVMTVKCTGERVGEIAVEVLSVKAASTNEAHILQEVKATLSEQDTYYMSILWSEVHISGSPFKLESKTNSKPKPSACKITELDNLSFHVVDKSICFKVDTTKAGEGVLTAFGTDPSHGTTEVVVDDAPNHPGVYNLCLTPAASGLHTVSMLWSGTHIPGSPMSLNVVAPRKCSTGSPVTVEIEASAKLKHLKALAIGPSKAAKGNHSQKIRTATANGVTIDQVASGKFKLQFVPTHPGIQELHVLNRGVRLPESPFYFDCEGIPQPKGSVTGSTEIVGFNLGNEKFLLGVPFKFTLHCEELGNLAPEITCESGESAVNIQTLPAPGENSYYCKLVPLQVGEHIISVQCEGRHIFGSPFHVKFAPRSNPTKCKLVETLAECSQRAGEDVVVCVSTKGAGRGKLTASVKSCSTSEVVPATVTHPSKHHHNVFFSPSRGMVYELSVNYDEIPIPGSPFEIKLGDASQCVAQGEGLSTVQMDRWSHFLIDTVKAGVGDLTVTIEGEDRVAVEPRINPSGSKYNVSYQPPKGGTYRIHVLWNRVHIPGSPFEAICVDPDQFRIVDQLDRVVIGRPIRFMVTSEIEIEEEKLTVFAEQDDEQIHGQTEKVDDLMYSCTLQLPKIGNYSIHTRWGEAHITGSPFEMEVVNPIGSDDFEVTANELDAGELGVQIFSPRRAFKYGELAASVQNAAKKDTQMPVIVNQISNETCTVKFRPTRGHGVVYFLSITYEGTHILGSPFRLISSERAPCRVRVKGVHTVQMGTWSKFSVLTRSASYEDLDIAIRKEGGDNTDADTCIDAPENEDQCEVKYLLKSSGVYVVTVTHRGQVVPGTPFRVQCCDPASYSIREVPKRLMTGDTLELVVTTEHAPMEWECLTATAKSKTGAKLSVPLVRTSGTTYAGSLDVTESDHYKLHVYCCGVEVDKSPLKFKVLSPPIAANIRASGPGLSDGYVGEKGVFTIDASEGGDGYINVKVQGPSGFDIDMKHTTGEEKIVLAHYNPAHEGEYLIHILWSEEHIPGSPFSVYIADHVNADAARSVHQPMHAHTACCSFIYM